MIKMIALDLGGVIITMDNDEPVRRFKELGIKDVEHMLDPYVQSGLFGDLEQGKISEEQFRKELSRYAGKELTWEECQYGWKGYVKEVPQYNLDAMLKLRNMGFRVVLASNTNGFMQAWADSEEFSPDGHPISYYCDAMYRSHEMHEMKPSDRFFRYMLTREKMIPSDVLFVDDSARNCASASQLGMHTFCPYNGADWVSTLLDMVDKNKV
ncbi:HAD hydrolase, family IA, variant 3 [Bacteroidales bacterium KA00344]|nr:HAD hydrolase, family IA, variant 3 [Bacteroidales bacterium KA00344]